MEAKETAKVFEDFVATFDECDKATKTFVRGSVINPEEEGIHLIHVVSLWFSKCCFEVYNFAIANFSAQRYYDCFGTMCYVLYMCHEIVTHTLIDYCY